jgi:hypothetical protein
MSLAELLPKIQELSQSDKRELLRLLEHNLLQQKSQDILIPGQEYPVWSPQTDSASVQALSELIETVKPNDI